MARTLLRRGPNDRLGEASAVLGLVAALNGERGAIAARALAELCDRRDVHPVARVLIRWAEGR